MNSNFVQHIRIWEQRVLLLLIYAIPLHEASKNILWGVLVALWFLRCTGERKCLQICGMMGVATLFWFAAGIWASFFAIEPYASWKGVWDMIRGGVLLWMIASHRQDEKYRITIVRHLILSAGLASAVAWLEVIQVLNKNMPLRIQLHSVGHYNQSGIYLAMAWMVALAAMEDGSVFNKVWLGRFASVFIGLALFGTTARTAIGVAIFGSCIIFWRSKNPRWVLKWFSGSVIAGVILLAVSLKLENRVFFQGSLHNRLVFWKAAWDAMKAHPWTGIGLNNFKNIPLPGSDLVKVGSINHAHSLYFNAFAQMGIPGGITLLILLITSAVTIWKFRSTDGENRLFFYVGLGVWLVIIITGVGNTSLHHEMSMFFFIVMGLLSSSSSQSRDG